MEEYWYILLASTIYQYKGLCNNYQEGAKMSITKRNMTYYPPLNEGKLTLTPSKSPKNYKPTPLPPPPPTPTTTYQYSKYT